jgi:hypothetical protein
MAATRVDVVKALEALLQNLDQNRESWENPTLERYLEAMGAWVQDWGNKYNVVEPSWEFVVMMLQAAKIYE